MVTNIMSEMNCFMWKTSWLPDLDKSRYLRKS